MDIKQSARSVTFAEESKNLKMERQEKEMQQHRELFRSEMKLLYKELQAFKEHCQKEMVKYAETVEQKRKETTEDKRVSSESKGVHDRQRLEEEERRLHGRNQKLIVLENDLDLREDQLSRKAKSLMDYEIQITETENYLERRFDIIKHKESQILRLDKELNELKEEMEVDKKRLQDAQENERRSATENWDQLRESTQEKQKTMETSLRRCKNELETFKDLNEKLSSEVSQLKQDLDQRDQRIKELEKRLSLSLYHTMVNKSNHLQHKPVTNIVSKSLDVSKDKSSQNWNKLRRQNHNVAKVVNAVSSKQGPSIHKHNGVRSSNQNVRNSHDVRSQTCALQ